MKGLAPISEGLVAAVMGVTLGLLTPATARPQDASGTIAENDAILGAAAFCLFFRANGLTGGGARETDKHLAREARDGRPLGLPRSSTARLPQLATDCPRQPVPDPRSRSRPDLAGRARHWVLSTRTL
jgi:hypothetical protein